MSAPSAKGLLAVIAVIAACARVSAFPPEVEQEVRAEYAIKRYVHETHPWWTCEYKADLLPREGRFLVRRVVLPGEQKCSRSHHDERFIVVYDPERDKIVKVRNPDVADLTHR